MRDDLAYWLALVRFGGFGPVRLGKLARRFPNMQKAFEAGASALVEAGIEPQVSSRFLQERIHLDPNAELARLEASGARAVTILDDDYPTALKTLYDPPALLFVRGTLPENTRKHLAVVGSRKATGYGREAVEFLVSPLAKAGVVIVSGLAYGIDACAHHACLEAGGATVAVLGSGVDGESIYPSANRALASRILASGGALISEFPLGTSPLKQNFPIRNRIIAGLCDGTLVIEAALKSGSLITARAALEAGREVYAVPGPIHAPLCEGPNNLIKMGATPATQPSDFFGMHELDSQSSAPTYQPVNEEERVVFSCLGHTPYHIDEIVRASGLPPQTISKNLTMLEMKGAIRHDGGQYYSRI